ncbi:hypothetical protein G3435_26830, partial [Pseudomonas sp. MAFF212428]|nr:hypothetical protein [Pseudomonas brassicae]
LASGGDSVAVATAYQADTLIVYQRDSNGELTPVAYLRDGQLDSQGNRISLEGDNKQLQVAPDGRTLYLYSGDLLQQFSFDPANASLTRVSSQQVAGVSDMVLGADGNVLYVSLASGSVSRYSTHGALAWVDSINRTQASALSNASALQVGADGSVLVIGQGLALLDAPGLKNPVYQADGPAVVLLPNLQLSDAELDALNAGAGNYKDATLVVERVGGSSAQDHFGFKD